jgi:hypothetical protein
MPVVGFEPTMPLFVRMKIFHTLDCAAIVIGTHIRTRTSICYVRFRRIRSVTTWAIIGAYLSTGIKLAACKVTPSKSACFGYTSAPATEHPNMKACSECNGKAPRVLYSIRGDETA